MLAAWALRHVPDRRELGWRTSLVHFEPVSFPAESFGGLRLAGAWKMTSVDPRFGGVSALALLRGQLVALTDSGAVVRFPKPTAGAARAIIGELPGGPGDPRFKLNRDSEALVRDGRGWWVAFENHNALWSYDAGFSRGAQRLAFGPAYWRRNKGIEAAATAGEALLLIPESGDTVVEIRGSSLRSFPISTPAGRISEAARLPTGELLVVNRRLTQAGFSNAIAMLERTAGGYRYGARWRLNLGKLDNVEALAAEELAGGAVRLWLMTDDNYQHPFRTLLIALDLPLRPPERPRPSSPARA